MPDDPGDPQSSPVRRDPGAPFPGGCTFGVATAGFQVEGGFNGPGEPANNWVVWERVGRIEPSGTAVGFWDRPEECLDRAAALGCDSFRLSVEWARLEPQPGELDDTALERYAAILRACRERGLEPLVTLHHFTHPAWLGEEFWLRPDSPDRFAAWVTSILPVLAPLVRSWVTVNEPNVLVLYSWVLGAFPPGRRLALADAAVATDHLLTAHVLAYEAIHRVRPDAVVTTNTASLSVYDRDRLLVDILLARSLGVPRHGLDRWLAERRADHDAALPTRSPGEHLLRRLSAARSGYPPPADHRAGTTTRAAGPRRAVDAVYSSLHERTLDVVGLDWYDPWAARHLRLPGHRTAGGRQWLPARAPWDEVVDPGGLRAWLETQHRTDPELPLWVVENGLCTRVRNGRPFPRIDGWDRPRYLREHLAALVAAADAGVPVTGYWHWSLVDNYEWGSYQPRFGLFGVDRHRGPRGFRWLDTDAAGADAAGEFRRLVEGLRSGDRSVLPAQGP